jgi:hypothetical protein
MDLRTAAQMWPAPVVKDDQKSPEAHLAMKKRMGERDGSNANRTAITSLTVLVKTWEPPQQWEAPSVAVTEGSRKTRGGDRANELLLTGQAEAVSERWSSPKASDPEKAGPNMRGSKGDLPLPAQAGRWAGPAAQNHKGSSQGSITRQDGKSRADILSYQAEQFFHPPSSPAPPTTLAGALCSTDTPNTNQPSVKRKLNPIFVEALMRWPTGLSGFERPAMASIPSPLPSHTSAYRSCLHDQHLHPVASEELSALRQIHDTPATLSAGPLGEAQVVRQGLHGCGPQARRENLPALREGLSPQGQSEAGASVLLDSVRQHREADQGTVSQDARWPEGQGCASRGEGARDWQAVGAVGGSSPQGPSEAEQRSGQPWTDDQLQPLADAHEGKRQCSAFTIWWLTQSTFLSKLFCEPIDEQMSLF